MLVKWATSISLEEVNSVAASLLSFVSHIGNGAAAVQESRSQPGLYLNPPGPTHATAIVACLPVFTDPSGNSTGEQLWILLHDCLCPIEDSDLQQALE